MVLQNATWYKRRATRAFSGTKQQAYRTFQGTTLNIPTAGLFQAVSRRVKSKLHRDCPNNDLRGTHPRKRGHLAFVVPDTPATEGSKSCKRSSGSRQIDTADGTRRSAAFVWPFGQTKYPCVAATSSIRPRKDLASFTSIFRVLIFASTITRRQLSVL